MALDDEATRSVYQKGADLTKWALKFIFSFLKKNIDSHFEKKAAEKPKMYTDRQKFIANHKDEIKTLTYQKPIYKKVDGEDGKEHLEDTGKYETVPFELSRAEAEEFAKAMTNHKKDVLIQKMENGMYTIGYETYNDFLVQDIGKTLNFVNDKGEKTPQNDRKTMKQVKQEIKKQRAVNPALNGRQNPVKHKTKDIGAR